MLVKQNNLSVSNRPFFLKYGLALSSILYVLLPNLYHSNLLWSVSPFLILIPSVIVSAWYGGLLPGMFATLVGLIIGDYFFTHPFFHFYINDTADDIRILLFGIIGILVSILSQQLHNALSRAKQEVEKQKHIAMVLKQVDKQKSTFLNVVAHELKTPLAILRLITYRITDQAKQLIDEETNRELDGEFERLTVLVDDLLDVSRIEKGKLFIEKKNLDVTHLIRQVVTRMQQISPHHKISIELPKRVLINADELRIKQVLINLIGNAVKHSAKHTAISVAMIQEKDMVIVSIKDHGVGISKKDLPNIFDMFYQVQDYFTKGFGLGLYISKEIVTQHGGKIWVESVKGKGSTFYFSLPKK